MPIDTDWTPGIEAFHRDRLAERQRNEDITRTITQLRAALMTAREKLKFYKKIHPEYVGGMEYSSLMSLIDEALANKVDTK